MTRPNHAQATGGTPRDRRRQRGGGEAWVRPFCRVHRSLDASLRLIDSTIRTMMRSERCAARRPVHASRNLHQASAQLIDASARLARAARALAETNQCLRHEPEQSAIVPELLEQATERFIDVAGWLQETTNFVSKLHEDVLQGLATGELVPERPAERRPRIRLAPRPAPVRAFLRLRQPRVVDRITPILRRRRRTPRPAAVRVPRRSLLGRAPPLVPISLL